MSSQTSLRVWILVMIPHDAFDLPVLDGDGVGSHFGYDIRFRREFFGARANITRYCCIFGTGKWSATARLSIYRIMLTIELISGSCVDGHEAFDRVPAA